MSFALRGIAMVYGDPRFRRFIWRPLFFAALLYIALLFGGYILIVPRLADYGVSLGLWRPIFSVFGSFLYVLIWFFFSGLVFLGISGWLSSLMWDRLSLEIERTRIAAPNAAKVGCGTLVFDAIFRIVFSIIVSAAGFILGLFSAGIAALLFAGWIGLYDYTSCAYLRRGIAFPKQMSAAPALKGSFGFVIASGLAAMIPFLNIFLLPGLVAGGTLMVLESGADRA